MDTGLNMSNRGQQFELQFPPIDPSSYESSNSYSDAGPTRIRRSRPHSITPYSRNNNNNFSAQTGVTSKNWLHALINSILPSFMSKFLGLTSSRREGRRDETVSSRLGLKNDNEMDIDQQRQEGSNGIQERLVQSNRIFMESIQQTNGLSSRVRRRSEMQNNSIKRKRSETSSIEAVEENLRRQAQIEDQNHKPDLKELYYKNIDPNWYKPFKNNPDNYPKFASSSRVTSDTYGPDQNLNLPKESPPLKKFKPSVIPTPRWFDYYPDKDEDMIDRRRTENIVEKRKAEEKTIEKEKALHKSKKGKEKVINFENRKEKSGTTLATPINISPLKDQNYFAININKTPVIASSPQMIVSPIENRPLMPPTIIGSSKISITEDKGKIIVTTPDTTAQSTKSPSSMESIVYTHENKDDNKSSLEQTPVTSSFANLAEENKRQSTSNGNDSSQTTVTLVPEPKSEVLVDTSTPLIVSEKDDGQIPAPLPIESNKDIEKEAPQEKPKLALNIAQDNVSTNSVISLPKDNQSLSLSLFTTLTSNNDIISTSTLTSSPIFNNSNDQPPITLLSNDIKETGKTHTDDEKETAKIPITQPKDSIDSEKKNGQGATITIPSFFPLSTDSKTDSPLISSLTPTAVSTSAPSFSFGLTSSGFSNSVFTNDISVNSVRTEKPDRPSKSRRPYGSSMNSRNKKNRRGIVTSIGPTSSFGSGNENTSQQMWQPTPSTSASIFDTPASPMFGSSQTSASDTGFNTNLAGASMFTTSASTTTFSFGANATSMFGTNAAPIFGANTTPASTTTFNFGANASAPTSIGFASSASTAEYPGGFLNSQNSTTDTRFGTQSNMVTAPPINFSNSNGQPNNLSFDFNGMSSGNTNPFSFGGSDVSQGNQGNQRKIRKMRKASRQ